MSKKTVKTENNAVETEVVAEQPIVETAPISEIQEEALQTVEVEQFVETVSEMTVPDMVELKTMLENGDLEYEDLERMVAGSELTAEQFQELTQVEYVPSEDTGPETVEYMYSTASLKSNLDARLKTGPLNAGGALALITANLSRNEISQETFDELSTWLKSLGDSSISGASNDAGGKSFGEDIKDSILRMFHPEHENLKDAAEDMSGIVKNRIKQEAEFEGTKVAQLVIDCADIAYHLMKAGELTVTYREVPRDKVDGEKGKAIYCKMHDDLWNKIKEQKLLGEVEQVTSSVGSKTRIEGVIYDPYSDKSILAMRKLVTMKACLLAYGHETNVVFGYVSRKLSTTGRMARNMLVLPSIPEKANAKDYFKVAALPRNALIPNVWAIVEKQRKIISVTKDGPEEKLTTFTMLQALGPNDETDLCWLPDEAVEPLYQRHFANHRLIYNIEERGDKKVPHGSITGSHDPNFPPVIRQRETTEATSTQLTKLKEDLAAAKTMLDKKNIELAVAHEGIDHANLIQSLQAISGRIANEKVDASDALLCNALEVAMTVIKRAEQHVPGNDTLRKILELRNRADAAVDHNPDDDKWFFVGARDHVEIKRPAAHLPAGKKVA